MKKTIYRLFRSISTKVVLIMLVMVLPLNLIAIVANERAIDTMVTQNKMAAQTLADTFAAEVEARNAFNQTAKYGELCASSNTKRQSGLQNPGKG